MIKCTTWIIQFHLRNLVSMNKVAIIGFGNIGKAVAFRLLENRYQVHNLCIIDPDDSIEGAYLDMTDAATLHQCSFSLNDQTAFNDCDVIFHCAGASVPGNGDRLAIAAENIQITQQIFEEFKPKETAQIIVVSNPVDVISYYSWKYSRLPTEQVVGTGTLLDSMRLNRLLEAHGFKNCDGIVLGEHGNSMFISKTLSKINDALLTDILSIEDITKLTIEVAQSAKRIKRTQSATIYGVVEAALTIYKAFVSDEDLTLPVSTLIKEEFNQNKSPIFISQLCQVNRKGVWVRDVKLNEEDQASFLKSSDILRNSASIEDRHGI